MIKKILHFSDLHIKMYKEHDLYKDLLVNFFKKAKEENPDRIVFTGDLVHNKNQMTPELVSMISYVLQESSKICKSIFLIGNHDFLENNLNRLDSISPVVEYLKNDNIVYYTEKGQYTDDNVDWIVYSLKTHNEPPKISKSNNTKIGLFHGPVSGLTTDKGFQFKDGYDSDKFIGCDLVLCGDIHKRQTFEIPDGKKAYMVGSLICQNYGESATKHGYGVYDLESDKYTYKDLFNPSPYLKFKINSDDVVIKNNEILINK